MKLSIIVWVILAGLGLLGALMFSAFCFGFFTVGVFLIFYDLRKRTLPLSRSNLHTSQSTIMVPSTAVCPNCGMDLMAQADFCPRCGKKVVKK